MVRARVGVAVWLRVRARVTGVRFGGRVMVRFGIEGCGLGSGGLRLGFGVSFKERVRVMWFGLVSGLGLRLGSGG